MTESEHVEKPPLDQGTVVSTSPKVLTSEEKRKLWTRRIVGALVLWCLTGCAVLYFASQAVTFLFKSILTP